jgi:hypothetical protein
MLPDTETWMGCLFVNSVCYWVKCPSFGAGALVRFGEAVRGVDPVTERSVLVRGQPQVDLSLDLSFAKVARVLQEGSSNRTPVQRVVSSCQPLQVSVVLQLE